MSQADDPPRSPPEDAADSTAEFVLHDLTDLLALARSGLRRDVALLVGALDRGALLVPLVRSIAGVPLGEAVQPEGGELTLVPHLLPEREGVTFVPLFSDPDVLRTLGQYLAWTTDGGELEFCTLPAKAALDLALQLVDGERVVGAVINPSDDSELFLQRHEIGSFCQGQPLPLVGYVGAIAEGNDEKVLVAELAEPPSPEFLTIIDGCLKDVPGVVDYRLQQTFNAERDLEPHPSLTIRLQADVEVDKDGVGRQLFAALEGKLPEPGYIDVLFEFVTPHTEAN